MQIEVTDPTADTIFADRTLRRQSSWPVLLLLAVALAILGGAIAIGWYALNPPHPSDVISVADGTYRLPPALHVPTDPAAITPADPDQLVKVTADQAVARNAAIPIAKGVNPAASALTMPAGAGISFARSADCLTLAIYYEAAREPLDGQRAVAQVILNRVRHPNFPHTVCGVVFQGSGRTTGCQFTFTCDGSLGRPPVQAFWGRARMVALAALGGSVYAPVGWATYYHAYYVLPYWAPTLTKLAVVGRHIFYRIPGGGGAPSAFSARYAGNEPNVATLRATAEAASAALPDAVATPAPAPTPRPVLLPTGAILGGGGNETAPVLPTGPIVPAERRWVIRPGTSTTLPAENTRSTSPIPVTAGRVAPASAK